VPLQCLWRDSVSHLNQYSVAYLLTYLLTYCVCQACRGRRYDAGAEVEDTVDSAGDSQAANVRRIPIEADVLLAYSVVPGNYHCTVVDWIILYSVFSKRGRTLAIAPLTWVRLVTSSALQSRKWQLIGMRQWCSSALCGHPLPTLTDSWTHDAASRHTISPISHTRPSPRSHSYYSFPVPLRVGGWVGRAHRLATCSRLLAVDRVWVALATSQLRVRYSTTRPLHLQCFYIAGSTAAGVSSLYKY